jgi:hypothetical protein
MSVFCIWAIESGKNVAVGDFSGSSFFRFERFFTQDAGGQKLVLTGFLFCKGKLACWSGGVLSAFVAGRKQLADKVS